MYEDSGPATKATIAAISSTDPKRLSAVAAFCGTAQSPEAGFKSVSIGPGWTLLTVMPRLPSSLDKLWVNIFTAPLVAEYATRPGATARSPTADPMVMMRPPLFKCLSAACVAASVPRRLMSITRSISSSVVSTNVFGMAVPALFTSTSSWPKVATVLSTAPLTASTSAASAWIARAFPPSSSIALTTAEAARASFAYVMATIAPSAARRFAIAAPMPREPPVTSATLLLSLDMGSPLVSLSIHYSDVLSSAGGLAAVDGKYLPGHERGRVGSEEDDRSRNLVGLADPTQRNLRHQPRFVLCVAGEAIEHARVDRPGGNGVDAHAGCSALERGGPGDAFHGVLAAGIHRSADPTLVTVGRGDVDDAAALLRRHHAQFVLQAEQHPEHVGVEGGGVALDRLIDDQPRLALGTRTVDGGVDPAEPGHGLIDQLPHLVVATDVGLDERGLGVEAAKLGLERLAFGLAAARDDQAGATLGEGEGSG